MKPHQAKLTPSSVRRTTVILLVGLLLLVVAAAGVYGMRSKPGYTLEYSVKPVSQSFLQVDITVNRLQSTNRDRLEIYKGKTDSTDIKIVDAAGEQVPWTDQGDTLSIETADRDVLQLSYKVQIGEGGKHGVAGRNYGDLIAFDGDHALMLPVEALSEGSGSQGSAIRSVSVRYDMPQGLAGIVPYAGKDAMTTVSKPDWSDFYTLLKSSYIFGSFEKHPYVKGKGAFDVYVDYVDKAGYTEEMQQGITALYNYYSDLFGFAPERLSVVLLRKDPADESYIIAGSSSQTIGATFDAGNPRDWELLSHRMFHAFYETKMTSNLIHLPPQTWFYEGMATYYENASVDYLPEGLKKKLGLSAGDNFLALFRKYIYMRLKAPDLLALNPAEEEKLVSSPGKTEFLHYTQAPLTFKLIEDAGAARNGRKDIVLRYMLKQYAGKAPDLDVVYQYALGDQLADVRARYINGHEILPLWSLAEGKMEQSADVIKQLNDIEYLQWSWFRSELPAYKLETLKAEELEADADRALKAGVHFSDSVTEAHVKKLSSTLYNLLMQHTMNGNK